MLESKKESTIKTREKVIFVKWPLSVMFMRHDTSAYNVLRDQKRSDPTYKVFLKAWRSNPDSEVCRALAIEVWQKFALSSGDASTPLADPDGGKAYRTGLRLSEEFGEVPDQIFVSPYLRTLGTLKHLRRGWPALNDVDDKEEERVREQEHGLALIYNDWRVFETLNPEQRMLRKLEGPYWYRYPQGENVPDVRLRLRSWMQTLSRDYVGKKILVVSHHLTILSIRANFENWSSDRFIEVDEKDKPRNCSITLYRGHPEKGKDGRLLLDYYNKSFC
jgi:broad specificity phosphatase PhoE